MLYKFLFFYSSRLFCDDCILYTFCTLSCKLFMNVKICVPQTSTEEYFFSRTHCSLSLNYPLIILYYHNSIRCHSTRRDKGGEQLYCDHLTNVQWRHFNFTFRQVLRYTLEEKYLPGWCIVLYSSYEMQLILYIYMNCRFCSSSSSVKLYIPTSLHCLKVLTF